MPHQGVYASAGHFAVLSFLSVSGNIISASATRLELINLSCVPSYISLQLHLSICASNILDLFQHLDILGDVWVASDWCPCILLIYLQSHWLHLHYKHVGCTSISCLEASLPIFVDRLSNSTIMRAIYADGKYLYLTLELELTWRWKEWSFTSSLWVRDSSSHMLFAWSATSVSSIANLLVLRFAPPTLRDCFLGQVASFCIWVIYPHQTISNL